ncbi:hypothetical protein J1614_001440 [Plenodomus biglobosus]|nr:hypothetical protein J1614_001440 [Plenodomus biglobosus]
MRLSEEGEDGIWGPAGDDALVECSSQSRRWGAGHRRCRGTRMSAIIELATYRGTEEELQRPSPTASLPF